MDIKTYKQMHRNFKNRNIDVYFFDSVDKLKGSIKDWIPEGSSVGIGALFQKNQGFLENYFVVSDCNI